MVFVMFLIFTFITHVSAYIACPKCGNIEVPYPLSTAENCGDTRYRVFCNNDILEFMSAEGFYYKILSINPTAYKLVINPPPLMSENTCYSSDLSSGGLRLNDDSPFNISSRNTVMLFNCTDNILFSPLNCSSNSLCRQFEEKVVDGSGCRGTLCCHYLKDSSMNSRRIRVRVGGCTSYTSVVGMKPGDSIDSWNYGIELQWLPPN